MTELLIEILSEEIPARMQNRALSDFTRMMTDAIVDAGLSYSAKQGFVTPRRLVLILDDIPTQSTAKTEERKGPRTDAPAKAIEGFLRATGLTIEQLEKRDDKKGEMYYAKITTPGRPAADIIAEALDITIRNFPWPKSMRWGVSELKWVRPLHSIIAILSEGETSEIINFIISGIRADRTTHGHRFLAPDEITVHNADDYTSKLTKASVILDATARMDHIRTEATNAAFALGLELVEDEKLLAENAGLVEYPVVYLGEIEEKFRALPAEVLQTSMAEHQKFQSLRDKTGAITGYVIVANRSTADNGATIKAGNAKVLRARLSDAVFFWENDLRNVERHGVEPWLEKLSNITFHNKLGTQGARIERIVSLAREIAPLVGANADDAATAARLAKADLASEMVYEFPELQGIMGTYYAKCAGHSDAIAAAATTHYAPLGPSDDAPAEPIAIAVSLADKIDILTGFWAINEKPTGSKDPFALRRAALGVIRIILENDLRLGLYDIFANAFRRAIGDSLVAIEYNSDDAFINNQGIADWNTPWLHSIESWKNDALLNHIARHSYNEGLNPDERLAATLTVRDEVLNGSTTISNDLSRFLNDRLAVHLRDQGIRHDILGAMNTSDDIAATVKRVRAVDAFLKTEDGTNMQAGIKRALNILSAEEKKDGVSYELDPEEKLMRLDAELGLFAALNTAEDQLNAALAIEDHAAAMSAIGGARGNVDKFFEDVIVNDDNAILRRNRLCLLNKIRVLSNSIGDFTKLEG